MSDRDLGGPLPEDLRNLLDAERELEAPMADTRERLLDRLGPLLLVPPGVVPDAADLTDSATAAATKTIAHAGWRAKVLVPVLSAALGSAGGAATHAYLTRSPSSAPAASSALEAKPTEAPTPKAASAAPEQATLPEATPPAASSGPTPATPPAPSSVGTLRAERLLLESATAALMRGDPTTALGTLQKHARQYPHGALSEEREVLWVKALRAQGNDAAAEKRANDFKRRFPSSLQQGALDNRGGSR
jgi:TolA-binding protein